MKSSPRKSQRDKEGTSEKEDGVRQREKAKKQIKGKLSRKKLVRSTGGTQQI